MSGAKITITIAITAHLLMAAAWLSPAGDRRVIRGGSYQDDSTHCSTTGRDSALDGYFLIFVI